VNGRLSEQQESAVTSHDPNQARRIWLSVATATAAASVAGCAAPRVAASDPSDAQARPRGGAQPSISSDTQATPTDASLALHVLNRFAYGPRTGDLERVMQQGAQAWIEMQLRPDSIVQSQALTDELASRTTLTEAHAPVLARFARLQGDALSSRLTPDEREAARKQLTSFLQLIQREARDARVLRAMASERQLEEVLVEFWFNHFNVFGGKESVRATVGYFESEAIRPYVLSRFRELLGATARHPAMLNYLDNWASVREGFRFPTGVPLPDGFVPPRGLNENYARELLELHTLGVQGGYTQSDVTELARIFSGWSFDRRNPGPRDAFRFYPARHDDGPKRLLGQTVPGYGMQQGEWALDLLARHPSTARHISYKLAAAFVSDIPPASLVDRLAKVFHETDGDLRQVMRALARSPEFLDPTVRGAKFKQPFRYVVSSARACDASLDGVRRMVPAVARMGMPIYLCPTPDGWRDAREAWLNPEALRQRVDFAAEWAVAQRRGVPARADALSPSMLRVSARAPAADGPHALPAPVWAQLGPVTRTVVHDLPESERLAVALASPDFMRR
jgi:hypothetical protein